MQAVTHTQQHRRTTSRSSLTLNTPWMVLSRLSPDVSFHVSFPTTASIAARIALVVKGLAMKLLSPIKRPLSTSDFSGLPVTRMKPIFAVGVLDWACIDRR